MSTKITRTALGLGAAAVLTFGLAACHGSSGGGGGSSSSPSDSGSGAGPATASATVEVKNYSFEPASVTVKTGGKVTWKFEDSTDHNVDLESLNKKSKDLSKGGVYSTTFSKAGTYSYICSIHSYMTGKVVVK